MPTLLARIAHLASPLKLHRLKDKVRDPSRRCRITEAESKSEPLPHNAVHQFRDKEQTKTPLRRDPQAG